MKRVISFLLICCMLALALVACGDKKEDPKKTDDTSNPSTTEVPSGIYGEPELGYEGGKPYDPNWMDDLDFGGETINVMLRNSSDAIREWGKEDVEDDPLDLQINTRNELMESNLNIDVNFIPIAYNGYDDLLTTVTAAIQQDVDNKLHDYDIVAHFAYVASQMSIRDYQENLLNEDIFPYFNFDLACWNQTLVDSVAVNNKLYFVSGDINLTTFDNTIVVWHNKDLYESVKSDSDPEDLQDVAIAGDWHYSELYKWSQFSSLKDASDACGNIYGVHISTARSNGIPFDAVPAAFDFSLIKTNADGSHSFNVVNNTRAEQAMTDWRKLLTAEGNTDYVTTDTCGCKFHTWSHFVDGKVIFSADMLYRSEEYNVAMREMDDTYALLPMPKYDEDQTHYSTVPADCYTLITVLDHSESSVPTKGEAISAYLQYATEYSYVNVRQYYFYEIVEATYFGVDDSDGHVTKSITIFREILDNIRLDFATVYSPLLNDVVWLWRDTTQRQTNTLSQIYSGNQATYDNAVYELDKWLGIVN